MALKKPYINQRFLSLHHKPNFVLGFVWSDSFIHKIFKASVHMGHWSQEFQKNPNGLLQHQQDRNVSNA
jgi:hypothetical protein